MPSNMYLGMADCRTNDTSPSIGTIAGIAKRNITTGLFGLNDPHCFRMK
jgi:hypothetical protein